MLPKNVALVLGGGGCRKCVDDSVSSRWSGRSWSRYDRGRRRSGDCGILVRGHCRSACAQRRTAGGTVRFDSVSAGSPGRTEPGTAAIPAAVPAYGHGVREDEGSLSPLPPRQPIYNVRWARSGWSATPHLEPAAEQQRAMVAARLPHSEWPDRPMIVVAVNAHTGDLAAFDRYSGVDLVDAVTASTAMPGLGPTHNINGTSLHQRRRALHRKRRPRPRAIRTSWCSPFGGRSGGHYRKASSRGCVNYRARTWQAGVEALREQGSLRRGDPQRMPIPRLQWARTRWIRRPASPPPVPVSPKASRKRRPASRSSDDCTLAPSSNPPHPDAAPSRCRL